MRKFLVLSVTVLVLLAAYLWFAPEVGDNDRQSDREFVPDYIAENLTLRVYDQQGYIADHLQAKRLEHFEQLGFTQFEQPRYTLFNDQHQAAWEISSQQGIWFPEDKIILEQQVLLRNLLPDEFIENVETASLQLLLPEKTLQTHEQVRIIGPGFYIMGIGMQADLTAQQLVLQKHLKTVYANEN